METLVQICQVIVGCGLLNVWLLRFNKSTAYRGGTAANMLEEFAAYGLPAWSCYLVGFLKVTSAFALLAALIYPSLALPAVKGTQSAASRVVGVLPLSGSQRILTVEVGTGEHKTWLVLGVTPSNIQLLHTLPPQDTDTTAPGTHPSFAQALQRLRPGAADKP